MSPLRILVPVLLCPVLCSPATPQTNAEARVAIARSVTPDADAVPASLPIPDLRIDVPLLLVPVHVTTAIGTSVTTLKCEQFRLFEDNVEQKSTSFSSEDAPVSI